MNVEEILALKPGDPVWLQWPEGLGGRLEKNGYTFFRIDEAGYAVLKIAVPGLRDKTLSAPVGWLVAVGSKEIKDDGRNVGVSRSG